MRFLRSPRAAVWLVLSVTAYSLVATVVPQTGLTSPETIEWMARYPSWSGLALRLGLFSAFTTPIFLVLVAWLTVATAVCAWDRTRRAKRLWDRHGVVTTSTIVRLRENPQYVVAADAGSLDRLCTALRQAGLRVRQGPRLVVGTRGRSGLVGSPLFHWSLVLFFVVVALGQLTRSEGQMGIPVGSSRPETAASYGQLETGALFMGHSGLTLSVPRIQTSNVVGGIDRQAAPRVVLSDGERVLRDQLVYPNHPLRFGAFIVHRGPFGFSLPVSIKNSGGQAVGSDLELLVDTDANSVFGTRPTFVTLEGPDRTIKVTLTLAVERGGDGAPILSPKSRMPVRVEATGSSRSTTVTAPGTATLPDGLVLTIGAVRNYARVGVVYDWSVTWIYALLIVALAGLSIALLTPHRVVRVLLVDTESGSELHAIIESQRGDPLFVRRVVHALDSAAASQPAERPSAQ